MELTEAKRFDVVVLDVGGRIDATSAPALEQKLLGILDAGERRLVIDCTSLRYISSGGLRVLLMAAKRLAHGGALALAGLSAPIQEIFDVAGFSSIFRIYRTQDDAVAAVTEHTKG